MPFGVVFGALFFGVLCTWTGLRLVITPGVPARIGGTLLILLGVALALGLLMRRPWARWAGAACALGMALFGAWLAQAYAGVSDFLLLFASVGAVGLLLAPATGSLPRDDARQGGAGRALGGVAAASAIGLLAVAMWSWQVREPEIMTPAMLTSLGPRVSWSDYGRGIDRARAEDKLMLVNFITQWCGYCREMDRTTWKHPSVVERTGDLVPVKVDCDDTTEKNGYQDAALASLYAVQGTPALALVDGGGRVLARTNGYQSAREFLEWLERSLAAVGRNTPDDGVRISGASI